MASSAIISERPFGVSSGIANPAAASKSESRGGEIALSADQIAAFRLNGFLVVENATTPEELAEMRVVYDRLFVKRLGWETGDLFDMVSPDNLEEGLTLPQMLWPSRYEPYFCDTLIRRNAYAIAQQILGPAAENMNEHAILKPAFKGAATPWHQDESFNTQGSGYLESIAIWMPLQDVSEANGCLWYVPKSNLGPLHPHHSPNDDPRIHGLETTPPDLSLAVPVCMPAGAVVIHHSMTLHSAGVNSGPEPRRAYALGFGVKTERNLLLRDYPWNLAKQTAREARYLHSLSLHRKLAYKFKKWLHGHRIWN
jgi:ectoine hydroxylase-related dioxygenase (phytanoyl-CoA dioxygenase family)